MAARIKEAFQVDAELIRGGGGIYDIKVDGQLVYSRHANDNQFPESDESVVESIESL